MKEKIAQIATESRSAGLEFLLVGGQAVIALGFERTTRDVDLLISDAQQAAWREFFLQRGYKLFNENGAFLQFASPTDLRIDILLADAGTWEKLRSDRVEHRIGDAIVATPSALKIIAMKLHAAQQRPARIWSDWEDIHRLMRHWKIDVRSDEVRAIFLRYADEKVYERFAEIHSDA